MKLFFFLFSICFSCSLLAQNVGINATGATPNASAMLDVSATNKGMLVPRMTSAQRTAISSPATGLLVFDNETLSFWFYGGAAWIELSKGTAGWSTTGNSGTDTGTNFIGTTDGMGFRFKVNNQSAGLIGYSYQELFLGYLAGDKTGSSGFANDNTGIGAYALQKNDNSSGNTAVGTVALQDNVTGGSNTAVGLLALQANVSGNENTAVGANALSHSTVSQNTAFGTNALSTLTTANGNTAIGYNSLENNNAVGNTSVGFESLMASTSGYYNTAVGTYALLANTTGVYNTALGAAACVQSQTGNNNTGIGFYALQANQSSSDNTAIGTYSLTANTGGSNTAVGSNSLANNSTGYFNTSLGTNSLTANLNGFGNVAVGINSLEQNNTGVYNVAIGAYALRYNTTGSFNIGIGENAGNNQYAPGVNNSIGIGNDDIQNGTSNQVLIGDRETAYIGGAVGWSSYSDARIKTQILEKVPGLDFILKLRPVTYHFSHHAMEGITGIARKGHYAEEDAGEKINYAGFLAQEVEKTTEQIGFDFGGLKKPSNDHDIYTLNYEQFIAPLVKAVQEQQKMIQALEERIKTLEAHKN